MASNNQGEEPSIGPLCTANGITVSNLLSGQFSLMEQLTNGIILELHNYVTNSKNYQLHHLCSWVEKIFEANNWHWPNPNLDTLRNVFSKLKGMRKKISRNSSRCPEQYQNFLKEEFKIIRGQGKQACQQKNSLSCSTVAHQSKKRKADCQDCEVLEYSQRSLINDLQTNEKELNSVKAKLVKQNKEQELAKANTMPKKKTLSRYQPKYVNYSNQRKNATIKK